jgi:cell division protein FtsZ
LDVSVAGARGVLFAISGGDDLTMMEIQEAAKIITENVDKDARIIFGAVRDERLKKGEIKITVIASGFPEGNAVAASLFGAAARKEKEDSGGIFGSFTKTSPGEMKEKERKEEKEEMPMEEKTAEKTELKPKAEDDEEDEWGAIPAFLRRKK